MHRVKILTVLGVSLCSIAAQAEITLPTLEEAKKISRESGKPILAMAGQKT